MEAPALRQEDELLQVESLDLDAQGIAHRSDGKVVFIEGALPQERVRVAVHRRKNQWEKGTVTAIEQESPWRVVPACPHYGMHRGACGGCSMQHCHVDAQVAVKQRALEDSLWHLGRVRPAVVLRPIQGPSWGYRYRARLSVRYVRAKQTVLVGFHERHSSYVADMQSCRVLPQEVGSLLMPLRTLIGQLEARERCPQIELACDADHIALVLRHLQPLSEHDTEALRAFAKEHDRVRWWLQPGGPASVHPLDANTQALRHALPEFGVELPFLPTDFTQVNPFVNRVLVSMAVRCLEIGATETVIDWFCGLGNFTLPIATRAARVLGVEGNAVLVERARQGYERHGGSTVTGRPLAPTTFAAHNLFELDVRALLQWGCAEKWLIDPPREGAVALVRSLAELIRGDNPAPQTWNPPHRIVYVSCNPATLARDAGILVHQAGYLLQQAGVVNMFPHTAHVESIAVLDRMR